MTCPQVFLIDFVQSLAKEEVCCTSFKQACEGERHLLKELFEGP
jgi:hypothetical protein